MLENRDRFLTALKQFAASKGMHFCGFRQTSARIFTGKTLTVSSPWFTKAQAKRKRKKTPNGSGCHLGLEVLVPYRTISCFFQRNFLIRHLSSELPFFLNRVRLYRTGFGKSRFQCHVVSQTVPFLSYCRQDRR